VDVPSFRARFRAGLARERVCLVSPRRTPFLGLHIRLGVVSLSTIAPPRDNKHELACLASGAEQAMDLYNNDLPAFTTWVIENELLEEPFVVIDVGVQGGPHPRWKHLKDKVRVYGFDAIPEVIEGLNAQKQPNEIYFATALGDEEGTRDFYVRSNGNSYYGSSFYDASDLVGRGELQPGLLTKVPITRLDTLFAKGVIPPADHIKVDCEGHDPEVIRGAQGYLAQSNVVSVIVETAFNISPQYPKSHFVAISDILTAHRLRVFDFRGPRTIPVRRVMATKADR
jgi:FkbM family methyltransferase